MDRLTRERMNGIKSGYWSPQTKEMLVQALAAYENTGLTPEEIVELNTFTGSQVEALMLKLQQERARHQWIPVTEKLPDPYEVVLVTAKMKADKEALVYEASRCFNRWVLVGVENSADYTVTAWKSLPEPYTDEKPHRKEAANE